MTTIALTAKLSACSLAGVAIASGNVSAAYEQSGDKQEIDIDAAAYKTFVGFRNLRATLEIEIIGLPPAGLKVGKSGATSITPSSIDAADNYQGVAGTAIDLGTMSIDKITPTLNQDNTPTTRVSLSSVGRPWFVPAP